LQEDTIYHPMTSVKPLLLFFPFFLYLTTVYADTPIAKIIKQQETIRSLIPKDLNRADTLARTTLAESEALAIDSLIAKSAYLYGITCYYRSEYRKSTQLYKQALASDYAKNHKVFSGALWNNLGINLEFNMLYQEALDAYYKSLRISEQQRDSSSIAMSWINVGLLHYKLGDTVESIKRFQQARAYFENHRDTANLALCYQNLAISALDNGDYDHFKAQSLKAATLFHALNYQKQEADIYCDLADNAALPSEIQIYYDKAQALNLQLRDPALDTRLSIIKGSILMAQKQYTAARDNYLSAKEELLKQGDRQRVNSLLIKLASVYGRMGNFNLFEKYINEAERENTKLFQQTNNENIAKLKVWYDSEKQEDKISHQATLITVQKKMKFFWMLLAMVFASATAFAWRLNSTLKKANQSLFSINKQQIVLTDILDKQTTTDSPEAANPSANAIEQKRMEQLFQQIVDLVKQPVNLTNPNFGVGDVATALHTNERYVSQAINQMGGMNFNRLLNFYRINTAKKLLLDPALLHLTVEHIADRCGFGNPNTFYIRFKDFTGLTPRKFRNMHLDRM